jgi:hypothetical protein
VTVAPTVPVTPGAGVELTPALVVPAGRGVGPSDPDAGLDDTGAGLNDAGAVLGELVQAASGTLARMLSTMTNGPGLRTVRV